MTAEQQFWDWFKENESKYFFLNQVDDEDERERLLDLFLERLHIYCDQLFFEVGGRPDEKQDLIITAEGNVDFFDKVESLVSQAPQLEYWNVIAFKPVMEDFIIDYDGVKLDPKLLYFDPLSSKTSKKIGLRIYVENYDPAKDKSFLNAAYLLLDNVLGEQSNALNIGYVEVQDAPPYPEIEQFIKLTRLPHYIAWANSRADD